MTLPENCRNCHNPLCQITVPRFHYRYPGISSFTLIDGVPAQKAFLWDFFEFALKNCFQVQKFRVMLFYGLYEHDLDFFLREAGELDPATVIGFLRRTHQVVTKLTQDFKQFKKTSSNVTQITDLIPNMITIIQMELVGLSQAYLEEHIQDEDFPYTLQDILQ